ncbi:4-hydroxybenzoyl-CoA reductase subunit beta [Planctomycetes bacterium Pla163]|uniref:4-hydroxybenzoyl-CoA reductase subunit beta n=1 Tax=Rohdeia mirabilis TaxID=2528008 RepID=A0A518CW17_9BACT|nr:4-hydroxybenzoyl-CoA reductase subunit beta [Planctomycetes bacterium Pla163]
MEKFELLQPKGLREAVLALAEGDADRSTMVLAGGQDLLTEMKEHLAEPSLVVDISGLPQLAGIGEVKDGSIRLGANATIAQIAGHPRLRADLPILTEAADSIASPQIRSVATLGGNLNQRPRCWYYRNEEAFCLKKGGSVCYAAEGMNKYNAILGGGPSYIVHPSDMAPALIALDARVQLVGPDGDREVALADYYTLPSDGPMTSETVRANGEIVVDVIVPPQPQGLRSTYLKFKERESYDWALASVALAVVMDGGVVRHARMSLGGVAPKPWTVDVQGVLAGRPVNDETVAKVADLALDGAKALAHNGYKIPLTRGLIARAFQQLS